MKNIMIFLLLFIYFFIIIFKKYHNFIKNQTTAAAIGTLVKYTINKADDKVINAVA